MNECQVCGKDVADGVRKCSLCFDSHMGERGDVYLNGRPVEYAIRGHQGVADGWVEVYDAPLTDDGGWLRRKMLHGNVSAHLWLELA